MLSPFVNEFKEAKNETGRKRVINNASEAVKKAKALLEDENDLPKDLQTVCIFIILLFV